MNILSALGKAIDARIARIALINLVLISSALLGGCSSIIEGTSQTLTFNSNPPGAECTLDRNGVVIGKVTTPAGLVVEKTKHNINVTCRKEGFKESTAFLKSEVAGATFGNILLGGGIGWAIDSASGADNKYQEVTTVTLTPASGAIPSTPAPAAASARGHPSGRSIQDRLLELRGLRDQGLINEEEYQARRKALIESL